MDLNFEAKQENLHMMVHLKPCGHTVSTMPAILLPFIKHSTLEASKLKGSFKIVEFESILSSHKIGFLTGNINEPFFPVTN